MNNDFIQRLETRLQQPLPGEAAQFRMAHPQRRGSFPPPPHATASAVLALFFPKNEEWHLVFIERESSNANDKHKGQISFPGGRFDDTDIVLDRTALREAEEEVGVDPSTVRLLGQLTELYIPISNFKVNPYVGMVDYHPQFKPQVSEVKSILEIPFQHFQNPKNEGITTVTVGNNLVMKDIPYFDVEGKTLWGATAMMLSELLEIVGNSPFDRASI